MRDEPGQWRASRARPTAPHPCLTTVRRPGQRSPRPIAHPPMGALSRGVPIQPSRGGGRGVVNQTGRIVNHGLSYGLCPAPTVPHPRNPRRRAKPARCPTSARVLKQRPSCPHPYLRARALDQHGHAQTGADFALSRIALGSRAVRLCTCVGELLVGSSRGVVAAGALGRGMPTRWGRWSRPGSAGRQVGLRRVSVATSAAGSGRRPGEECC
jgi:hypothetical protein